MAESQTKLTQDQMVKQSSQVVSSWANLPTRSYDGWTALHLACRHRNEIFQYLVEEVEADLKATNDNGITLMHKAAYDDNNYIITYLVEKAKVHNFDINAEDHL